MKKIVHWLMCMAGVLALMCSSLIVSGQEAEASPRRTPITPALALATLTVSEAGWEADVDMRGIHAVLLRTQERASSTYTTAARLYARRVIGRERDISRRWLWGLNPRGTEPEAWPTEAWVRRHGELVRVPHPRWSVYRERWLNTYARAEEVVEYTFATWGEWGPCDRIPDDWGGDMDMERATRLDLTEVSCPDAENHFFIRPSTAAAD